MTVKDARTDRSPSAKAAVLSRVSTIHGAPGSSRLCCRTAQTSTSQIDHCGEATHNTQLASAGAVEAAEPAGTVDSLRRVPRGSEPTVPWETGKRPPVSHRSLDAASKPQSWAPRPQLPQPASSDSSNDTRRGSAYARGIQQFLFSRSHETQRNKVSPMSPVCFVTYLAGRTRGKLRRMRRVLRPRRV